jgi:GNAT superfamily N-acetyltransferase
VNDADLPERRPPVVERVAHGRTVARLIDADVAREQVAQLFADTSDRGSLLDVVDDGDRVVGQVWVVGEGDELAVYDAHLDDPGRVAELLAPLLAVARDRGIPLLGVGGRPHDATTQGLAQLPGATPRAYNMLLDLSRPVADPGAVELRPMSGVEFDVFFEHLVDNFAATLVEAGVSPEAAARRSAEQTATLLPSGLDSPGMAFFTGWVGDTTVGVLWLDVSHSMVFVYDVEVLESHRGKGYGAALMNAAALWSRDHGHPALGLNVFAHNPVAKSLYDKLGYEVTVDYRTFDVPDA